MAILVTLPAQASRTLAQWRQATALCINDTRLAATITTDITHCVGHFDAMIDMGASCARVAAGRVAIRRGRDTCALGRVRHTGQQHVPHTVHATACVDSIDKVRVSIGTRVTSSRK